MITIAVTDGLSVIWLDGVLMAIGATAKVALDNFIWIYDELNQGAESSDSVQEPDRAA